MELTGERRIGADRAAVWAALIDPEVLCRCVPGCSEMTGTLDDGYEAVIVQRVGPLKATFRGRVTVFDRRAPERLTIRGEGGGRGGHGQADAEVTLLEDATGTRLVYAVEAQLGGRLSSIGGRIVGAVAGRMAEQFFARFKAEVEGTPPQRGILGWRRS